MESFAFFSLVDSLRNEIGIFFPRTEIEISLEPDMETGEYQTIFYVVLKEADWDDFDKNLDKFQEEYYLPRRDMYKTIDPLIMPRFQEDETQDMEKTVEIKIKDDFDLADLLVRFTAKIEDLKEKVRFEEQNEEIFDILKEREENEKSHRETVLSIKKQAEELGFQAKDIRQFYDNLL